MIAKLYNLNFSESVDHIIEVIELMKEKELAEVALAETERNKLQNVIVEVEENSKLDEGENIQH